jgi:type IV fimbrial biogenesis protein FimT
MKAKSSGFTLLEIMIVIALLAVLIGIGAPSMGEFIRNSRITGKANDLLAGLNVARTEAIKRHVPVTVCATEDAEADAPECDPDADFSQWIAFVDDDGQPGTPASTEGDGAFDPPVNPGDPGEILLTRSSGSIESITTLPSEDVEGYVQFGLDGFQRRDGGAAPTDLSILMCDDRGNKPISGPNISAARALFITRTGRAEVSRSVERIDDLEEDCP